LDMEEVVTIKVKRLSEGDCAATTRLTLVSALLGFLGISCEERVDLLYIISIACP
jgi:hypothetical protein